MIGSSLEKLQRAVVILNRRDAPIEERLARAYLFGLAWIYPDAAFVGHEHEFDLLRDELARVYYGDRSAIEPQHLLDLERRVLALSAALIAVDRKKKPARPGRAGPQQLTGRQH